jgi:NAD(P)-dependent dehydrogenase (short-subunit alcohol dehydrogenase family)
MSSNDVRVTAVARFTETQHSSIPENLNPSATTLPPPFTICVIGASTGIGEHIAYSFAKARATNIAIASRTLDDLKTVAREIRGLNPASNISIKACDVSKASDVEALAQHVKDTFGRLDVLILNAGYAGPVTLKMDQGEPEWVQKAFDINAMGTYLAAHYFVPLLLQSERGAKTFLAIGSLAGCLRRGPIANTGYTVSKMAQIRLVEFLAEQFGDQGLVSLAIHPGAVMTRMAEGNTPEVFLPCKFLFVAGPFLHAVPLVSSESAI